MQANKHLWGFVGPAICWVLRIQQQQLLAVRFVQLSSLELEGREGIPCTTIKAGGGSLHNHQGREGIPCITIKGAGSGSTQNSHHSSRRCVRPQWMTCVMPVLMLPT